LLSTGVRHDERDATGAVPASYGLGERTDAVVQLRYDAPADWSAYGFAQETLSKSDTREDNGRYGLGGSYLVFERLRMDAEVSDGDLGVGGKLGSTWLQSDRTSFYFNYVLENERSDNGLRAVTGREGSVVTGVRTRFSDSTSVFLEERYRESESLSGLTHATGVTFAPTSRFNVSATSDIGTLRDRLTGLETDRVAGGVRVGFGFEDLQLSSGVEYRTDENEQLDGSFTERETWLYRNSLRWQLDPSSRVLGKFNHAISDSSLGGLFAGEYTEAVLGYAFRPVAHDRLNSLVKYTYFHNLPSPDQVTGNGMAAQYIQKSHIGAVDVDYRLTSSWSVGGKYAYRQGQISLDREDPEFFDNSAGLYVLRTDWRLFEHWELLLEGRMLEMLDLDERKNGALVAVSRYFGDHFKLGAGYNFADFSDDLTDLEYNHRGFFLNLTGVL
jgi:hypothetical protein